MSALDDLRFLARSESRVEALKTLAAGPRTRRELQEDVGVSRPTVGRILTGFVERGWVVRNGREFDLTPLGEHLADGVVALLETMETEARLRRTVDWLPTGTPGFEVSLLSEATVTMADPVAPYRPAERLVELIRETGTGTVRAFGTRPQPGYFDAFDWEVGDGLAVEVLLGPLVVEALREHPPEGLRESVAADRMRLRVCDELPCGMTLLDGHVALCGYDAATGMLKAVVDTDSPAAVDWATGVYERWRERSEPVDAAAFDA